jgi:uroporphyrinogen III methyltransferase/synthase
MGVRRLEPITAALIRGGRGPDTPAAMVQWGARAEQRVVTATLGTIAAAVRAAGLGSPAILFVGDVVGLRDALAWYDRQPLFGRRILVPRPRSQAAETVAALRARGAEPIVFPLVEITPPPAPEPFAAASRPAPHDWVVFTRATASPRPSPSSSGSGATRARSAAPRWRRSDRARAAALERRGIVADRIADAYVAEALADALLEGEPPGRVLLLRAAEAREVLPEGCAPRAAAWTRVVAYETRAPRRRRAGRAPRARRGGSGRYRAAHLGSIARASPRRSALPAHPLALVASIGPVTSAAARAAGSRWPSRPRSTRWRGCSTRWSEP